jgi:ABC-2 type transport system ATP-binding protein
MEATALTTGYEEAQSAINRAYIAEREMTWGQDQSVQDGAAVITTRGLSKDYGGVQVLRDLDLVVPAGTIYCLLGPNGSGKTTTVEILEGYRSATSGEVRVLGCDPDGQPPSLRQKIGVVPQEGKLPGYLSVHETIELFQGYYHRPLPTEELLEVAGLSAERNRRVRALSGGQRRRLDLAVALAGNPQLLFLDEPTTGFDPESRRRTWTVIKDLAALGKTVLLTTHYLEEATELASLVGILVNGRLAVEGTPEALRAQYGEVHIGFRLPAPYGVQDLPQGAQWGISSGSGDRISVITPSPTASLEALCSWAVDRRIELLDLSIEQVSLEDVYLAVAAHAASPPDGERPS